MAELAEVAEPGSGELVTFCNTGVSAAGLCFLFELAGRPSRLFNVCTNTGPMSRSFIQWAQLQGSLSEVGARDPELICE